MIDTLATLAPVCGPAEVLELDDSRRVRLQPAALDEACWATLATNAPVRPGQQVLVVGQDPGELFAIAVLESTSNDAPQSLTAGGARAEAVGQGADERLRVYSKRGELLFEHDPTADRSRVMVPETDLEVVSAGNLTFAARGRVSLYGEEVNLSARRSLKLSVRNAVGKVLSRFCLGKRRSELQSRELSIATDHAMVEADEADVTGQRCRTRFALVSAVADRLESAARVIVQQANSVYHTARDLFQIDAVRIRTHASKSHHLNCKNALLRAEEDFKIDGEQIHLG